MKVLTVNAGSSSVKLSLVSGSDAVEYDDLDAALAGDRPDAVAHRVVHGGDRTSAESISDAVVRKLTALTDLAPLHQPPALEEIARTRSALPDVPQVACFDTAFHTTMPASASTYAIPMRWRDLGVRKLGFHGLSFAWSAASLAHQIPGARRAVIAHLGSGASLCAVLDGRSVDTTMGFTPTDGLVMASRSGSLDPGAVAWLATHVSDDLASVLETESGLLALAGTKDMREVLARRPSDTDARLAYEVFMHRLVTQIAAMAGALGGLDVLVFTGGIGENSAEIRDDCTQRLAWLGVGTRVPALVIPAREDLQMAQETERLLAADAGAGG